MHLPSPFHMHITISHAIDKGLTDDGRMVEVMMIKVSLMMVGWLK